jgi:hypothetical protein
MPTTTYPVVNADILSLSTIDQIEIYSEAQWPRAFLRERLFPNTRTFQSVAVELNYRHLRRGLAPFVWRYQEGRILPEGPESSALVELPEFGPTRVIRADDALIPPTSSGVWVSPNATDYLTAKVAQNWREMELSHSPREAWLIAALLQTGLINLSGDGGAKFEIKFTINPPIQCGDANMPPVWDADMDLITWLKDKARALAAKCGQRPDTLIMGSRASSIFSSNKSVEAERTLMAYTQNMVPEYEDAAVTFVGRYAGLDVFEYLGVYIVGDANNEDVAKDFLAAVVAPPAGA